MTRAEPVAPDLPRQAKERRSNERRLAAALRDASYEILPFRSVEEQVLEWVPTSLPLTVTVTESKGLGATVDMAMKLAQHSYRAAPHLAARLVRDDQHLSDIVEQLSSAGIVEAFVVGGDAREPVGVFPDALSLLQGLERVGHRFESVGIGGYPEGHAHIPPTRLSQAMIEKSPHATHVITQLCFNANTTLGWARSLKAGGVDLPVRVGVPGSVNRQKLIRISGSIGLGQSARFLQKQSGLLWRFFLPGGYSPDRLVRRLSSTFDDPSYGLRGFHFFTFNELEGTERWRQAWLRALADGEGHDTEAAEDAR
jgi:methylenetetrahydrofolate reductase (NADPH)